MTLVMLDPEDSIVGRALADTEEEVAEFRAKMQAKHFKVTARRRYEWFKGERFPKPGVAIRLKWETM